MQTQRFNQFIQLIDGIHKSVTKIKHSYSPQWGVKSVHLFWLYELMSHPEGLTAAALAAKNKVDRSLISREIEELREGATSSLARAAERSERTTTRASS